ncbi:MAG TPA: NADH-quinone oxidoreductase subunit NuoF, partial [bacterium]|nr:NADH-quinone oxidoreductase subunit NuoF [bacterium]
IGTCDLGPVAIVYPDGIFYVHLKPEDAKVIVNEHLLKGRVVNRLLYQQPMTKEVFPSLSEIDFIVRQKRIVLRNMGVIDPESIEEYIAKEGYQALAKALTMSPEDVIDTVKKSGLRGRGGAGFPTGLKWELTRKATGNPKYVICNGDEGDPGAFMDRSVLEGDPHSIIEGMMIAGYAVGASKGFFYVRAEYPLAIKRIENALEQARSYGLIGENILGTDFSFDIELRRGSGAFVCGEETALIASIEGGRGEPRPRPPYPANRGLWDSPTVINNVETLANISPIILNGAEWFSSTGTEKSKGTKVFALAGKVNNTGLIEVPFGTTLGEIIFDVGGGIPGGKKFKAAQTGGPSGGCIPAEYLDLPIDYESLKQIGAIVGSGGLIIMDEDTCMVDVARFFLEFTQSESCGKCPPCRVGTRKMLDILERIVNGEGEEGDIERLIELGEEIRRDSLCGLGQTAPNPVLSTIRFFRDEYEAHIREKRCPAKSCRALIAYQVIPDKCRGCGICARVCPVGAAQGKPREIYHIDTGLCIKCGDCFAKCPFGAIEKADLVLEKV